MQAVIRKYSGNGAKELFDLLEKRQGEIEDLLRSVTGFISYTLAHTDDGSFTVTVCQGRAGIDESVQVAKDWISKNAADTGVGAPEIILGEVVLHLT